MLKPLEWVRELPTQVRIAAELATKVTPQIDERMLSMAEAATNRPDSFFQAIGREAIEDESLRPDSIKHHLTVLAPNAYNSTEIEEKLGYLDYLLGDQLAAVNTKFDNFSDDHNIFERIKATDRHPGEKFVFVSDHPQLANIGYEAGLFHLTARKNDVDRLEDHLAIVVGRLVGYFMFGGENVMDGILRKVGSVIKTFPAGGSEAMSEDEKDLELFRRYSNHQTKEAFRQLMTSRDGKIVCMAPSGEEDKVDKEKHRIVMRAFGRGTCDLLIDANNHGATLIPTCMDFELGASIVEFGDPLPSGSISTEEDCHQIGQDIATMSTLARGAAQVHYPENKHFTMPVVYNPNL
jgi:hypothetical protein